MGNQKKIRQSIKEHDGLPNKSYTSPIKRRVEGRESKRRNSQ